MWPRILLAGMIVGFASSYVQATVYGWKSEGNVLCLSNDLESVPESHRATAQKFMSKLAGKRAVVSVESAPSPEPITTSVNLELSAYERGLEKGLQVGEQRVALAGELARTVLAAVPRTPPPRIIIQQPGPTIIREVTPDYYVPPFYGFIGPEASWPWGASHIYGYSYGFRRLAPHSHFFPGSRRGLRARRTGLFFSSRFRARHGKLFFPHGHVSHHGFLSGHGFVVR